MKTIIQVVDKGYLTMTGFIPPKNETNIEKRFFINEETGALTDKKGEYWHKTRKIGKFYKNTPYNRQEVNFVDKNGENCNFQAAEKAIIKLS